VDKKGEYPAMIRRHPLFGARLSARRNCSSRRRGGPLAFSADRE